MAAEVELGVEEVISPVGWSSDRRGGSVLRRALRTGRGRVGATLALFVVLVAAIGPAVAPDSPNALTAIPFSGPTSAHVLGTDMLGRDVLSRVLDGGWKLLLMSLAATVIGVAVGTMIGVLAAFRGGVTDTLLMRAVDVLLAFPQLVFGLLIVSVLGAKLWLIVVAVAIGHAPQVARVIRSAALDVCERDFVKSAELIATPSWRVMFGEIVPNLMSPITVEAGLRMTYSVIIIAGLSFLGFGLQPPAPSWGVMINENRIGLTGNPWAVLVPIVLLALLTIGTNTFADAVARASMGTERARARRRSRRSRRSRRHGGGAGLVAAGSEPVAGDGNGESRSGGAAG
jgi:peptide/nickel transport system permease protein